MHLTALLERAARIDPRKDAVVHGDEHLTYGALLDRARRAATVLTDRGLGPGDRVAVQTFNTPGFVVAAFGVWFAGGVLVPVNHKLAVPETAYAIEHSGARIGIVAAELALDATVAGPQTRWLTTEARVEGLEWFDELVERSAPLKPVPDLGQDDVAQFLYTSGTTGAPKACVHTHRTISAVQPLIVSTLNFTSEERFLLSMPVWHAAPLNDWLLTMVFLGATTILQREYDPAGFLEHVERYRATAFFGAPIAYIAPTQLAAAGRLSLSDYDLSSVTRWLYGGAPLGAEVARTLMGAYGSDRFVQVYGVSEMGPVGTALHPHEQLTKAGSIGRRGMPGVDLRVVGDDGRDVDAPGTGEIWLRADTAMVAYHQAPEATAESFSGPWFRTGDVARVDEDGYLYIVDRLKDVIIVGGENVHSQEVEEALRGHPRISDIAVVGRPHPAWGESVVAVYVSGDGAAVELEEMREYLGKLLARYKLPREAIRVDRLPRNPSGKLTKHIIRSEVVLSRTATEEPQPS
ncbi:class I adenylate-forming enzyme family protein [Streptomyces sp. DT24]|uniref:class I adenylate-forming enzyme family protein n=1 Tax=unclassified Streptomyces TaxID=2593676 RepID=UPI0023B89915|nr:AMP-binding protein [Streptomyces sp. AM 4-1-1]WEH32227.1 AMP-binding protein [Streptomyces sp. AM 4-1-1]